MKVQKNSARERGPKPYRWALALVCCCLVLSPAQTRADVLIVLSHEAAPYREVQAGFQVAIAERLKSEKSTAVLVEDGWRASSALRELSAHPPRLILTLGAKATRLILTSEHEIPVIAALVVNEEPLQQATNATAVTLDFPAALQWRWLRQMLPKANRVGVLYSPRENDELFQELTRLARAEQVELEPLPADSPASLPALFQHLPRDLDVVWPLSSTQLLAPASVREMLLYSFRNRVPLIGLSTSWVEAGALYALERDYTDLGHQCAELAQQILAGSRAAKPASQTPRAVRLAVNLKTAAHMKLDIPKSSIRDANTVFR